MATYMVESDSSKGSISTRQDLAKRIDELEKANCRLREQLHEMQNGKASTAQSPASEDLALKNQRLELAWEASKGGIIEHSIPVDETTYVSEHWAAVLGYSAEEVPHGEALLDWLSGLAHQEDLVAYQRAYDDVMGSISDHKVVEMRMRHRDGKFRWVRKIIRVIARDSENKPVRLLKMMMDISDIKSMQASLVESEARFEELADSFPLMTWFHPAEGQGVVVNNAYCEFFGVSKKEMRQVGVTSVMIDPEEQPEPTQNLQYSMERREPYHSIVRARHADGGWRWVESWGHPRYDSEGLYRGFVGVSNDITQRKETEQGLQESEARFRLMADNISQLAWMAGGGRFNFLVQPTLVRFYRHNARTNDGLGLAISSSR